MAVLAIFTSLLQPTERIEGVEKIEEGRKDGVVGVYQKDVLKS